MGVEAHALRDVALLAGVYAQCASTAGSLALVSGRVDDEEFMAKQTDALFNMCVRKGVEAVEILELKMTEGRMHGS